MKWRLQLFGSFELVGPEGRPFRTKSSRLKLLLACLAMEPSCRAPRRCLAEDLFDADDVPTSPNLALLLTRALASLASHSDRVLIRATPDHVGLVEDNVEIDIVEFEDKIKKARAESDSNAASRLWKEALLVATEKPFAGLDHQLLFPLKERVRDQVMEALVGFTQGIVGDADAELVLHRIREFDCEQVTSSLAIERIMRIYAALGMKKELISAFTQFETQFDYEFGETVQRSLARLFEALLHKLDQPLSPMAGRAPERPVATFGRDEVLRLLKSKLNQQGQSQRLTTLIGQSGIGKSHLLRELYWMLTPSLTVAYFDMESTSADAVKKVLAERTCDFVLADHVSGEHRGMFAQLIAENLETKFVCASQARLGFAEEFLVPLGPLGFGTADDPGPAVGMLLQNIGLVHADAAKEQTQVPRSTHFEMASLCEGIPLALEIAGRLAGSIGAEATVRSLRGSVGVLSNDRRSDRRSSLGGAIESSFRNLSAQAQRLISLLCHIETRCHIDHLLSCSDSCPLDLEEAILSGLVVREPSSTYVRVRQSTGQIVSRIASAESEAQWGSFCLESKRWFDLRSQEMPLELGIAESLPLVAQMTSVLSTRGEVGEAIALFASIRPWIGSLAVSPSLWRPVEELLMCPDSSMYPEWAPGITALAAAYFHSSAFDKMAQIVEVAIASSAFMGLSRDLQCQLKMQVGLAKRCLGDHDGAIASYREAVSLRDFSVNESTLVKCYYNLGTLLEAHERLEEALEAQESAADHFTSDTDARVETLVNTCIGRLRYRLGGDLASAGFIMEATLAHARERHDLRSMGEVLQNLGLICWERGLYLRAALAEAIGSITLLEFGYSSGFRGLAKSSCVTLCGSLLEIGEMELANATRTLIDRLGDAELYTPNKRIFERVAEQTYHQPPLLRFRLASESEVREHLEKCCQVLASRSLAVEENSDLVSLLDNFEQIQPRTQPVRIQSRDFARTS